MRRRTFVTTAISGLTVAIAGCGTTSDAGGDGGSESGVDDTGTGTRETTTETPVRLGSDSDPWSGAAITVSDGDPETFQSSVSATVSGVLVGDGFLTGYVETSDVQQLLEEVESAGFSVRSALSAVYRGLRICRIQSHLRFPREPEETAVRDAFPDAVQITSAASAGGGNVWIVASTVGDQSTIETRLDSLDVDTATAVVQLYDDCVSV